MNCLPRRLLVALAAALWLAASAAAQPAAEAWRRYAAQSHAALAELHARQPAAATTAATPSAVAPEGVAELTFAELFGPVGDRGLEFSARLRALEGRTVRMIGCMVRGTARLRGAFLLAARPAADDASGRCAPDAVPAAVVHVVLADATDRPVPYRPGWLTVTGRVELGARREADGRNSFVRLVSDSATPAAFPAP